MEPPENLFKPFIKVFGISEAFHPANIIIFYLQIRIIVYIHYIISYPLRMNGFHSSEFKPYVDFI